MRIVCSLGDPHGIGPEVILKSFLKMQQCGHSMVVAGSLRVMEFYRRSLGLPIELERIDATGLSQNLPPCSCGVLPVIPVAEPETILPGTLSAEAGSLALESLQCAAELCRDGICDALVTAPIHKEALALAGCKDTGHTGFLGRMFGVPSPIMMFADGQTGLKVALATIHEPISRVPSLISSMDLDGFFRQLSGALKRDFAINEPSLAVLGLNPHASDGGVMGSEEGAVISPAIERLHNAGMHIEGPFPADGFFGSSRWKHYDGVVAMYHDQGLLPFKVMAFESGVNVTLGLPIVRTSPDHGTGFDRAGTGTASEESFYEAAMLAISIAQHRNPTGPVQ